MSKINKYGQEVLSQTPIAAPVRVGPSPNTLLALQQQYQLAYELARRQGEVESPEEADDFAIGDYDPSIPFEHFADRYDEDLFQSMLALHNEQLARQADLQPSPTPSGTPPASSGNPTSTPIDSGPTS